MIEFYILLLEHLPVFVLIFLLTFALTTLLFRKHISSVFDPLFYFLVVTESFCIADVIFMAFYDFIEIRYLIQYLASEIALFAGVLFFSPRSRDRQQFIAAHPNAALLRTLFQLSFFLFVSLNLLVYATRGVPILLENRLEVYQVGGGFGFISRMFDVLLVIIFYYLLEMQRKNGWHWREWACLFVIALIQLLSGAKSSVLTLVFIAALYMFYLGANNNVYARVTRLLNRIFFGAVVAFLVVAQVQISDIQVGDRNLTLFDQAALRFVNNGDAFTYAYPKQMVETLDGRGPILAVMREYVAFFRLVPAEDIQMHLGLQISKAFNGNDTMNQTNAKHNLFGYVNFGFFGSIVFSLMLGLAMGYVRYILFRKRGISWVTGIPYILLNLGFISSVSDSDSTSRAILNVAFVYCPLLLASFFILRAARRSPEDMLFVKGEHDR